ncbi:hypothetical protein GQ43DRAFT_476047 [Delitschia confertaspora ATCC 74209]|uniref:Uncharacterized protein n=1 Tax=Delitschia confertaspora ATCC 74209 TaxID=1513339 RepID=A0A9P4ML70_9PLEO|nr:hypothetical protein GQ43DRAFT_476047 [Delitschia confertaspora ATCC 74209]
MISSQPTKRSYQNRRQISSFALPPAIAEKREEEEGLAPSPTKTPALTRLILGDGSIPSIWVTLRNGQRIPHGCHTRADGSIFGLDTLLAQFPGLERLMWEAYAATAFSIVIPFAEPTPGAPLAHAGPYNRRDEDVVLMPVVTGAPVAD